MGKIWECKIGAVDSLPEGSDLPLRQAVQAAYKELTGRDELFCFSGWGGKLDKIEEGILGRAVETAGGGVCG